MKLIAWIVLLFLSGCAMNKPPLHRDECYPSEWFDITTLDSECKGLDGTYANEGLYKDGDEIRPILLTSILPGYSHDKAKSVTLRVITKKVDSNSDSIASLQIGIDNDITYHDSYCVQRTLFYTPHHSGGGVQNIAIFASQQNVWLTKALDGSLIAKVWDQTFGMIVLIPFYMQSYTWAQFDRIGD